MIIHQNTLMSRQKQMENKQLSQKINLSEKIYKHVYHKITSQKFKPGEKITETMLAESFGVSRAPVREALKRLAEDHLVILIPRTGCYIAKPDAEEIHEIYDIRKKLEPLALERAFIKMTQVKTNLEKIKQLRHRFDLCKELDDKEFVLQEIKLDNQLHNMIYHSSQSPNLQEMLEKLRSRIEIFRIREAHYLERARDARKEHMAILDAIINQNKTQAIVRLEKHIENTKQNVLNSSHTN